MDYGSIVQARQVVAGKLHIVPRGVPCSLPVDLDLVDVPAAIPEDQRNQEVREAPIGGADNADRGNNDEDRLGERG